MSASKPVTPLEHRRGFPGESENTRIPVLSPTPFRRCHSLRMRTSRSFHHDYQHYRECDCGGAVAGGHLMMHPSANLSGPSSSGVKVKNALANGPKSLHQQRGATMEPFGSTDKQISSPSAGKDSGSPHLPNGVIGHHHGSSHSNDGGSFLVVQKPSSSQSSTRKNSLQKNERGMSLNLISAGHSASCSSSAQRSPRRPHTPSESAGQLCSHKSALSPKTPPVSPESPVTSYLDDDLDSLHSYSSSVASGMSCDHPYVARNGTTFSGRKMKYVVHCSSHAGQTGDSYLTPTQRAQRQIRRLKELLSQCRVDLEQRDSEILRLTKEVVELRLFKASLSSPEERSNSSDAVTVRENTTNDANTPSSQGVSPIVDQTDDGIVKASPRHHLHNHGIHQVQFMDKMSTSEMQSSFADSGHFEDITTSSIHSKDSYVHTQDRACGSDDDIDAERKRLVEMYETRIEELIKQHQSDEQEIRMSNNDRIEALLQKLAESNSRYCDLVPDHEMAKERIRELEKQLEELHAQLQEQEGKANKMYLHMYTKGQEVERQQQADRVMDLARQSPSRVSVPVLMQQLQVTQEELENIRDVNYQAESSSSQVLLSAKEAISLWLLGARKTMYKRLSDAQQTKNKVDPEVTLQFLKSAIYYFLTDKENSQGHLNAIESILGFSETERSNIDKARAYK
ncbi:protein quick-to-court-like isoform X1 [Uranotaenia lowii]|uniref:protein quick-to-court-like isoform X1 n=1 Tax=Uranotaenia lowii TaxID=190385 RepID=UPI00247B150C|nr:protein quick-to-court-like isoform X1 [Uranotaenia lowii]XP_055594291.1 protein quick-to-court-like isoform X1 [Uranotaenia lowii]